MNSSFQVLAWLMEQLRLPQTLLCGTGASLFHDVFARCLPIPHRLTDDPRWLTLIDDWGEVHRQHDVCEFLEHILQKNDYGLFQGTWQARLPTMAGETQLVDTGQCTQSIVLHMPSTYPTPSANSLRIQSLVDTWCRGIDRIHGLTVAPPVILLQLHRFTKQRDRVLKNHLKVQLDHVIQMPFFSGDRHNLSHRSYKLKAFIEHHGATPTSGHYTATLVNDEGSWSCDDGRAAKVKTMRGERHPTKTGYALFYSLDAALATSSDEGLAHTGDTHAST
ncbi:unnamed protein product [Symbiodinium sp. CCMP2592]|nr:unnamed protein product [Symbiodinium sp. CCMP2592]